MTDWPLTQEQILALPAGPETDALVATHFMGWHAGAGAYVDYWLDADGKGMEPRRNLHDSYDTTPAWSCSTDGNDALQVWEEIRQRGWCIGVTPERDSSAWLAVIDARIIKKCARVVDAPAFPLLIARTALLVAILSTTAKESLPPEIGPPPN